MEPDQALALECGEKPVWLMIDSTDAEKRREEYFFRIHSSVTAGSVFIPWM
jgi:hypothetical protein